jgi:ribulose-phosphate 3-epimerase
MIKIAPSVLSADFTHMADDIRKAENAGADWLHIDIMDGHFCPNLTMGPDMVRAIRKVTDLFLDVHLMVTNPENFFESFAKAGADLLTFHIETGPNPDEKINMVRNLNCQVGLSLNPDKSIDAVMSYLDNIDLVLLMSVFPGFSGQKYIAESTEKAALIHESIKKNDLSCLLEIDGGVSRITAPELIAAGSDVLVMGSAFFGESDQAGLVRELKSLKSD